MDRLEQLYAKMVDESPRFFPESNRPYILELARVYATEMVRHNLERAAEAAQADLFYDCTVVDKKSITSLEIELI